MNVPEEQTPTPDPRTKSSPLPSPLRSLMQDVQQGDRAERKAVGSPPKKPGEDSGLGLWKRLSPLGGRDSKVADLRHEQVFQTRTSLGTEQAGIDVNTETQSIN